MSSARGYDSVADASVSGTRRPANSRSSSNIGNSSHDREVNDEISIKEDSLAHVPFWDKINVLQFTSITLENKGSVARDHMANERTFLAWLRTSLSFITIGIGVTQLFRLEHKSSSVKINSTVLALTHPDEEGEPIAKYGKPLGSVFIVLGIVTLIFGMLRFFKVQTMLTKNYYPATRLLLLSLILVVLAVILVTFLMVIQASI